MHARSAIKDGTFLAVRRDGVLVVPERQLDGDQPVKHLVPVLRLLRDAKYSDEEALRWLATPDAVAARQPVRRAAREPRDRGQAARAGARLLTRRACRRTRPGRARADMFGR